jgi:transposase-like protein
MKKRAKKCPYCKTKMVRYSGEHNSGYECPKCLWSEIEFYAEKRSFMKKFLEGKP